MEVERAEFGGAMRCAYCALPPIIAWNGLGANNSPTMLCTSGRFSCIFYASRHAWGRQEERHEINIQGISDCYSAFVCERAGAGGCSRHDLRTCPERRPGTAELAAAPQELPGSPVLAAQRDRHRNRGRTPARLH